MSIRDEMRARVSEGRLFSVVPLAAGTSQHRVILITEELKQALNGPWDTEEEEHRIGKLQSDLDMFVSGEFIGPKYLRQLRPNTDEVWEIKSPNPRPSIRVFGRFAERDVFIATHFDHRPRLGGFGSREFKQASRHCIAKWRKYFPTYPPHTGSDINAYVSNAADPNLFR